LLKRTSINYINNLLQKNPNWNILDIGCGYSASKYATIIADKQDLSSFYKEKKFVQILNNKLPFKDKEFDFIIASHVIEHVQDFKFFISELERISSKGYIELPSRLGDNLIFENKKDHIWWFIYDDLKNELVGSKKNQLMDPFMTVSTGKKFEKVFRESFVMELLWENNIEHRIDNQIRNESFKKISFFHLVKKYLSKRFRSFVR
jgi:ubiquinone/menaquinone biosynthesis C-methylase UbiE